MYTVQTICACMPWQRTDRHRQADTHTQAEAQTGGRSKERLYVSACRRHIRRKKCGPAPRRSSRLKLRSSPGASEPAHKGISSTSDARDTSRFFLQTLLPSSLAESVPQTLRRPKPPERCQQSPLLRCVGAPATLGNFLAQNPTEERGFKLFGTTLPENPLRMQTSPKS